MAPAALTLREGSKRRIDMIGNVDDAQFIYNWVRERSSWEAESDSTPEGWERLGSGCYRVAFRSPEGVVYKVQLLRNSYQSNSGEFKYLRKLWLSFRMPRGTRLPKHELYSFDKESDSVIAMECVPRVLSSVSTYSEEGRKLQSLRNTLCDLLPNFWDGHNGNFAVTDDNVLVPIDFGGNRDYEY